MPGVSPSCELFHGTMTSDFGASSLPRIDMPDICTSPFGLWPSLGVPAAAVLAGFFGRAMRPVRGAAAVVGDERSRGHEQRYGNTMSASTHVSS